VYAVAIPASAEVSSPDGGGSSPVNTSRSPRKKFAIEHATMLTTLAITGATCMVPVSHAIRPRFPASDTVPLPAWKASSRRVTWRARWPSRRRSAQV